MKNALIGFTGFVGGTLLKQAHFDANYRSTNIHEIENQSFDMVVCAGAPAQKWIANRDPSDDKQKIEKLVESLKSVKCNTFVLISTVDVFKAPVGVNELTEVDEVDLHPYGLHRRFLEKFVQTQFENHLIIRLPGLVGPGLRKNIIFDFLNKNNVHSIESRNLFQFYPMVNLWHDINIALNANIKLLHLTAEPVSVADTSEYGFGKVFTQTLSNQLVAYDFQSLYAAEFGAKGHYQYSARETLQAIRAYAQSEPVTLNNDQKAL